MNGNSKKLKHEFFFSELYHNSGVKGLSGARELTDVGPGRFTKTKYIEILE